MLFSEVRSEWWSQEVLVGCVGDRILIQPTKTNQVNFLLFLNFQGLFPLTLSARVARERFELSAIIFSMLFLPVKSGGDPTPRTSDPKTNSGFPASNTIRRNQRWINLRTRAFLIAVACRQTELVWKQQWFCRF